VKTRSRRARTERDLVFTLETGFVLFVAVLVMIGSAYTLGRQRGVDETLARMFTRPDKPGAVLAAADVEAMTDLGGGGGAVLRLPPERFTLRLRTTRGHGEEERARIRADRAYLRAHPALREAELDAYVFDNGEVYSVGIGAFQKRGAEALAVLKKRLEEDPGPPTSRSNRPYKTASVERIGDLGKAVAP
jgi:hypothetical protein